MLTIKELKELFEEKLKKLDFRQHPFELYDPINYTMGLGGKRLRPIVLLLSCNMFDGDIGFALHPAIAIEIFHNFTLVHDDIMDEAPIRRGEPTVYKKWNSNIAILSGDTMLALAYQNIIKTKESIIPEVMGTFTKTAIQVCEGQQYDMNFEQQNDVSIEEYIGMIKLKTAVLIAASLKIGAIIAGAGKKNIQNIYDFGINIGLAFQLMDDILDVYANQDIFGKKTGGDIVSGKKTFLYIKAYELANYEQKKVLNDCFINNLYGNDMKIKTVKSIYDQLNIKNVASEVMNSYYRNAMQLLDNLEIPEINKSELKTLTDKLMVREF